MKLLALFVSDFEYKPRHRTLDRADPDPEYARAADVLVALVHAEPDDAQQSGKVVTRLVKNIKWCASKNQTRHVILHSFAHLSEVRASPDAAREMLDRAQVRLESAGYAVEQTPFGYLLDLSIKVPGLPFARVFKSL
ncbi:MAG: threonyl-tRNA synthetase editing domain-containing protein [Gammaproteobacteria bacterium]|nr:threonyl-tRNA synthetase editing domain-containing protein [Gammaproteobacteria bacterium]